LAAEVEVGIAVEEEAVGAIPALRQDPTP
jgi:hypothetical protein